MGQQPRNAVCQRSTRSARPEPRGIVSAPGKRFLSGPCASPFLCLALAAFCALHAGCDKQDSRKLVIFHAASLALPFKELERIYETEHPGVDVVREPSSSRVAIHKVTETHRSADIVASADEALLRQLLLPTHAKWSAAFARNHIVIAYAIQSRYRTEIGAYNWYEVLLRDDVGYGYCNPNQAPVGYRTRLVWKLADLYYDDEAGGEKIYERLVENCPEANIRPHVNELIPMLQSFSLDYIFTYSSIAMQHRLEWIKLPAEIDLGTSEFAELYGQVGIEIEGKTPGATITKNGKPIVYGVSIVPDAQNPQDAEAFLELLLGPRGAEVMEKSFQEPVTPAMCMNLSTAPESLQSLMTPMEPDAQ